MRENLLRSFHSSSLWNWPPLLGLILATAAGFMTRITLALSADFPLNDGGLFYVMVQDLVHNHYRIPHYTSYNSAHIPFAYPPFAFYIAGLIWSLTSWPLIEILRFFPMIVSVLTIPAFYLLSGALLRSATTALLAVFAFAMLPRSFDWIIMGGGLTRSLGFFFAVLALFYAQRLYASGRTKYLTRSILCAGLTILSHPEWAVFIAYSLGILGLKSGRSRHASMHAVMIIAGAIGIAAPWWGTVLLRHGPSALLAPLENAGGTFDSLRSLVLFNFTDELYLRVLGVFGVLGIFICLANNKYWIVVWLLAVFLFNARGAPTPATIPLALLVAVGLNSVLIAITQQRFPFESPVDQQTMEVSGGMSGGTRKRDYAGVMLAFFLVYLLVCEVRLGPYSRRALSKLDRQAMEWVATHTGEDSRFVVMDSEPNWSKDYIAEWFPALTGRANLSLPQGTEWLPHEFQRRFNQHLALSACSSQGVDCVESGARREGISFTHIYIATTGGGSAAIQPLLDSLRGAPGYMLLYDAPGAAIFARRLGQDGH